MFNKLLKSQYSKHLLITFSGTGLAQLVPILFYPIVSRLFLPENFGTLATINQIASICIVIASLKFEMNILLCRNDKDAVNNIALTLLCSVIILFIIGFIFTIFIDQFESLLEAPNLHKLFYVPFISGFCIIIYQTYNEWCVRKKYFKNLSINKVINSSSISLSETAIGLTGFFPGYFLSIGDMIGRMISAGSCVFSFLRNDRALLKYINRAAIKNVFHEAKQCPKFLVPAQLLSAVGQAFPIFMMGSFFSQHDVGLFSMAFMVIVVPSSVISIAFRDVFRQKVRSLYSENKSCRKVYIKNLAALSGLSILIFGLIYLLAPFIFGTILGEKWIGCIIISRILIPMVAVSFVSEGLSAMMIITQKMHYQFYWQILYCVLTISSLYIGAMTHSLYYFLSIFVVARIIAYLVSIKISYSLAK